MALGTHKLKLVDQFEKLLHKWGFSPNLNNYDWLAPSKILLPSHGNTAIKSLNIKIVHEVFSLKNKNPKKHLNMILKNMIFQLIKEATQSE